MRLPSNSRSFRLLVVIATAWLCIAVGWYAMHLGTHDYPRWTHIWHAIVPIETAGLLYYPNCSPGFRVFDSVCSYDFKLIGIIQFALGPLLVLIPLWLGISWALSGNRPRADA